MSCQFEYFPNLNIDKNILFLLLDFCFKLSFFIVVSRELYFEQ